MKKYKIVFGCFVVIFLILYFYLDFYSHLQSFAWLIAKLVFWPFIIAVRIFTDVFQKMVRIRDIIILLVMGSFMEFEVVNYDFPNYKMSVCHAKFGPEFNARRYQLGIPEIPSGWQVKSEDKGFADWMAVDAITGHISKSIRFDPMCTVESEYDVYDFKKINRQPGELVIESKYAQGNGKDSVFYSIRISDSTRKITRLQADSIFAAEKIKKDY